MTTKDKNGEIDRVDSYLSYSREDTFFLWLRC